MNTISRVITTKNEYGLVILKNHLYFYKKGNYIEQLKSLKALKLTGFRTIKVSFVNKDKNIVYYKYDDDLYNNTLYDTLYFSGKYWNKFDKWFKKLEKNINSYNYNYFKETNSKIFFINRINLIDNSIEFVKDRFILEKMKKNFKTIDNHKYRSYYSNGDLTDTNICLNNKICDSECAGKNIIIADLAIFFVSILYGSYIYPKYHSQAYVFRKNIIKVNKPILNSKQRIILNRIILNINNNEFYDFKYLVIFRLITPFSLNIMAKNDQVYISRLITIIYQSNYNNLINNICLLYKNIT